MCVLLFCCCCYLNFRFPSHPLTSLNCRSDQQGLGTSGLLLSLPSAEAFRVFHCKLLAQGRRDIACTGTLLPLPPVLASWLHTLGSGGRTLPLYPQLRKQPLIVKIQAWTWPSLEAFSARLGLSWRPCSTSEHLPLPHYSLCCC